MSGAARALCVYVGLWGVTAVGVVAGSLVGGARTPRVAGRTGDALFVHVLVTNARLVGAIALAALAVVAVPLWRRAVDAVVAGLLAANAVAVGAAVGATGPQVIAWLVHVPFEWGAFAVAAAVYLKARREPLRGRPLAAWAIGALGLVVVAAGVEAWGPRLG